MSPSPVRRARTEQVAITRASILDTAERLFAEHGVAAVSSRQISEAAGQGNNAAVGYHFGSKSDLVRAIIRRHATPMEEIRRRLFTRLDGRAGVRELVTCVVHPYTLHLAALGAPSWYARFAAQVITEPSLRQLAAEEMHAAPTLFAVGDALRRCLPEVGAEVLREREDMAHTLIAHFCALRERGGNADWPGTALSLVDAVQGLYQAPVSLR
ncbi:TetR/AcrR family transcriptional regulator [Actinoplanes sp. DH11]|uniref:TetR/AcrR family transcriptional regulator n=1 Tax=Actinoplanes sp. DH11 TaxID=2857011 RepID=UPI001E4E0FA4|nr:TetR/AcrR family transcriptional regulator [Actinoplanes sp. DH11]